MLNVRECPIPPTTEVMGLLGRTVVMKNVWGEKKISVCCYHLSPQSLMTADPKELFAWLFLDE